MIRAGHLERGKHQTPGPGTEQKTEGVNVGMDGWVVGWLDGWMEGRRRRRGEELQLSGRAIGLSWFEACAKRLGDG